MTLHRLMELGVRSFIEERQSGSWVYRSTATTSALAGLRCRECGLHHWWVGRLYALDGLLSLFRVMSEGRIAGCRPANRLTTWGFHVKI